MRKFVAAAACGLIMVLGTPGAGIAGEALKSHQIKKQIPGRIKAKIMGSNVTMHVARSGSLSAKWDGERDTGIWRVVNDKLCIKFKKWMNGATRCSRVTRAGNSFRVAGVTFRKF